MVLTVTAIKKANDIKLFKLLSKELESLFPSKESDPFIAAFKEAPRGLSAMAAIHELDVSMTLDDLAWHFGNWNDARILKATVDGLRELEAFEAADLFSRAWEIVTPFLAEIKVFDAEKEDFHEYLDRTGIQEKINPLNERMFEICRGNGSLGLMQYWLNYAKKYPERCVSSSEGS
jgi:hypothetical protein